MTGGARVVEAERSQLSWDLVDLDAWLPADHRARVVLAFVLTLNLDPLYAKIKAREGAAGRPAADPRVLLALWLYAMIEGVGSAREVDRLSQSDLAYRWLRGGVPLDYHTLADFRTENGEVLDQLLSESLAALMTEGLVRVEEVIIDGTKVRAAANKDSFKTADGLAKAATLAAERVAALKAEVEADPAAQKRRSQAARERAARETAERAARARAMLDRLAAEKEERAKTHKTAEDKKGEPVASLSDPEARMMRFADGAVRPGWNVQVAATSDHGFIVGIEATDRRNDTGLARPMVDEVGRRLGSVPSRLIVDGGLATQDDIVALAERDKPVTVFAPVKPDRQDVTAHSLYLRAAKRACEPAALQEWRARMATADGVAVLRRRKRIELVNAHIKTRGLGRLLVRGLAKVRAVLCLHALAHNLMTAHRLRLATA
jgi:transposase